MRFRIEQQLPGPVERVEEALFDPAFLARLGTLPNLGDPVLLDRDVQGTRWRQRVRYHFVGHLSPAVTAVIEPHKLTWVEETDFDRATHRGEHTVVPDHYGRRLECRYTTTLSADASGTARVAEGEVRVRFPLVGGRVEHAIVSGMREHAAAEQTALADWLQITP